MTDMKLRVKFRLNRYPSYPETFSELELLKEKTALIIIDMQNDFLHPQGGFAKKGVDVSGAAKLIPLVKQVADSCRQAGIPVIYTLHTFRSDFSDRPKMYYELMRQRQGESANPVAPATVGLIKDSWNAAVIDELSPTAKDIILDAKHNFDSFYQTDLELILRNLGIENLIFTWVTCSICVETTLRSAYHRDFRCLLVEDCTWEKQADQEAATKKTIAMNFGYLVTSEDILRTLNNG